MPELNRDVTKQYCFVVQGFGGQAQAERFSAASWMIDSTRSQLAKPQLLLAASPVRVWLRPSQ